MTLEDHHPPKISHINIAMQTAHDLHSCHDRLARTIWGNSRPTLCRRRHFPPHPRIPDLPTPNLSWHNRPQHRDILETRSGTAPCSRCCQVHHLLFLAHAPQGFRRRHSRKSSLQLPSIGSRRLSPNSGRFRSGAMEKRRNVSAGVLQVTRSSG